MNQTPEQQKAAALAELLQGIANGGELQAEYQSYNGEIREWKKESVEALLYRSVGLTFDQKNWRVVPPKPEPRLVPYTKDNVPLGKEVRLKEEGFRGVITGAGGNGVSIGLGSYSYEVLLELWENADGTPCGTQEGEVKSDWPKWYVDKVEDVWRFDTTSSGKLFRKWGDSLDHTKEFCRADSEWDLRPITAEEAQRLIGGQK